MNLIQTLERRLSNLRRNLRRLERDQRGTYSARAIRAAHIVRIQRHIDSMVRQLDKLDAECCEYLEWTQRTPTSCLPSPNRPLNTCDPIHPPPLQGTDLLCGEGGFELASDYDEEDA